MKFSAMGLWLSNDPRRNLSHSTDSNPGGKPIVVRKLALAHKGKCHPELFQQNINK
ncbi:MAG TPA: hypothetical protein VEC93_16140 [Anaerolineae bacterium]|nr:hypothetical protein [Anaerolineae bacterium]